MTKLTIEKTTHFLIIFMFSFYILGLTNQNITIQNTNIEHLCFLPLIAFPEKALDPSNPLYTHYNENRLTPTEFEKILTELHNNNYILINLDTAIILSKSQNNSSINLPQNKKPLLLSFDNVSYKNNYQSSGEIGKIILDRNNQIATYSTKRSIQDRISYNNEFITILEEFILTHPSFSFNNARGVMGITGANGVLGYSTNSKKLSSKQDSKRAAQVVSKLKSIGWEFACNNYNYTNSNTMPDIEFAKELSLWQNEVKPIIGNTKIYIHPYGINSNNSTKLQLLIDNNFTIFFNNNNSSQITFNDKTIEMSRKFVSPETIKNSPDIFSNLFDCKNIIDFNNRT